MIWQHQTRPPILIGHSLGGILIKQALVNAHSNEKHQEIIKATFGLVFMGTPHCGHASNPKVALGRLCARIVKSVTQNTKYNFLAAVESGSLFSDTLKEGWKHQLEKYQIISCYEKDGEGCVSLARFPLATAHL